MWFSSFYPFLFLLVVRQVFLKCRIEHACYTVTSSALDSPSTGVSLYAHDPLWGTWRDGVQSMNGSHPQTSVTVTGVLTMRACCSVFPGKAGEGSLAVSGRGETAQRSIDLRKIVFFLDSKHIFHYVHELFQKISINFIQLTHSCTQHTYIEEPSSLIILIFKMCYIQATFSCLRQAEFS